MNELNRLESKIEKCHAYYDQKFNEYVVMDKSEKRTLVRLGRLMTYSTMVARLVLARNELYMFESFE